jgi:glutaredoxin 3
MGSSSSTAADKENLQTKIDGNAFVLFVRGGCPYCRQASSALKSAGVDFVQHSLSGAESSAMRQITGKTSVPQGFCLGKYVGGCNDGPKAGMGVVPNVANIKRAIEGGKADGCFNF